jgi:hypothetical protein
MQSPALSLSVGGYRVEWTRGRELYGFQCFAWDGNRWESIPDSDFVTEMPLSAALTALLAASLRILEILHTTSTGMLVSALELMSWVSPDRLVTKVDLSETIAVSV